MNERFFELKKEKQDRMINAGLKLFALNGYHHASTDDIVKEAKISKGLLFHYFGSKAGYYSFLFDYANRFTILELKSGIRSAEIDYFELEKQILQQEVAVTAQYPYMQLFLESVKAESDKKGQAAIEPPEALADDLYADMEAQAIISSYPGLGGNVHRISGILYYVKMGLLKKYLAEPKYDPAAYREEVLDYLNTLHELSSRM